MPHFRTDRGSGGWCRDWFAEPAGRAAPHALDVAQLTREHGCRDCRGERLAVAKVDSGLLCYFAAAFMAARPAAAIKLASIHAEFTNSYVLFPEAHSRLGANQAFKGIILIVGIVCIYEYTVSM